MAKHAPLAVFANLSLHAADGQAITVTARESVITVALPRLWSRQWVLGPLADRSQRHALLARAHSALQMADLTLQFQVRRQVVALLAPQSRPTRLSRLLGLGAMQVRLVPCLRALLGRSTVTKANPGQG